MKKGAAGIARATPRVKPSKIGERARLLRLALGLSRQEVADRLGVDKTEGAVKALEGGASQEPGLDWGMRLAAVLGVKPEVLAYGKHADRVLATTVNVDGLARLDPATVDAINEDVDSRYPQPLSINSKPADRMAALESIAVLHDARMREALTQTEALRQEITQLRAELNPPEGRANAQKDPAQKLPRKR